ncbi:MAG: AzlD domain-containing protein [Pseudomonadota bacterium]
MEFLTTPLNTLNGSAALYIAVIAIAVIAHETWRWLGLALGSRVDLNSPVFEWVQFVAIALVAGLVMRLVLFPAGALSDVPVWIRVGAVGVAIAAFVISRSNLAAGVLAGMATLAVGLAITA